MDISGDVASALAVRQGADQQAVSLSAVKRQAKVDLEVATMAMNTVKPASSDPNRGRVVDTSA
ncbi:MAG: hypothetical protein WCO00_07815 [Rhodospirillaceae bacterium]